MRDFVDHFSVDGPSDLPESKIQVVVLWTDEGDGAEGVTMSLPLPHNLPHFIVQTEAFCGRITDKVLLSPATTLRDHQATEKYNAIRGKFVKSNKMFVGNGVKPLPSYAQVKAESDAIDRDRARGTADASSGVVGRTQTSIVGGEEDDDMMPGAEPANKRPKTSGGSGAAASGAGGNRSRGGIRAGGGGARRGSSRDGSSGMLALPAPVATPQRPPTSGITSPAVPLPAPPVPSPVGPAADLPLVPVAAAATGGGVRRRAVRAADASTVVATAGTVARPAIASVAAAGAVVNSRGESGPGAPGPGAPGPWPLPPLPPLARTPPDITPPAGKPPSLPLSPPPLDPWEFSGRCPQGPLLVPPTNWAAAAMQAARRAGMATKPPLHSPRALGPGGPAHPSRSQPRAPARAPGRPGPARPRGPWPWPRASNSRSCAGRRRHCERPAVVEQSDGRRMVSGQRDAEGCANKMPRTLCPTAAPAQIDRGWQPQGRPSVCD